MKPRALVLILTLALTANGLAQDVATGIAKAHRRLESTVTVAQQDSDCTNRFVNFAGIKVSNHEVLLTVTIQICDGY